MSNAHKTGRTEQIVARIPLEDAVALRWRAKSRDLTVSAAVKQAIQRWLGATAEVTTNFQPRHKAAHAVLREDET